MMVYTHASSVNFVKFVIGCAWYGAIYLLAVRIALLQPPAILQHSPLSAIFTASPRLRSFLQLFLQLVLRFVSTASPR
jgi:hypothetical protein